VTSVIFRHHERNFLMPRRTCSLFALSALGLSLLPNAAFAQTIINTIPYSDLGINYNVYDVGYGQTFRLPTGSSRLDAFSLVLWDPIGPRYRYGFRNVISEWDAAASTPVGTPLFTSGTIYYDRSSFASNQQRFRIPTGGITLDPTKQYISQLVPVDVEVQNPPIRDAYFVGLAGANGTDRYLAGNAVYKTNLSQGGAWQAVSPFNGNPLDMAFRASFDMPYDPNILIGKPVTLQGNFGSGSAAAATVTDGNYLPAGTDWQSNTLWWTDPNANVVIDLGGLYGLTALNIQADSESGYRIEVRRTVNDPWGSFLGAAYGQADGPDGMQVRPDPNQLTGRYFFDNVLYASQFRISGLPSGANRFALSEFQLYGFAVVPEPGLMGLLVASGFAGGGLLLRRRKSA
jgi:hypothetical protein